MGSSKTPSTVGRDFSKLIAGQGGSPGEIPVAYNTSWALRRLEVRVAALVTTLISWSEPTRL